MTWNVHSDSCYSGNPLEPNSGRTKFESRPNHRLSKLGFIVVPPVSPGECLNTNLKQITAVLVLIAHGHQICSVGSISVSIYEVPGLKPWLERQLFLSDVFRGWSQSLKVNVGKVHQLVYDRLLPHPFQFIIHLSSYLMWREIGGNCIMRSFITCTPRQR
jgi:hypothetical protein